jgi:hypothetical protein
MTQHLYAVPLRTWDYNIIQEPILTHKKRFRSLLGSSRVFTRREKSITSKPDYYYDRDSSTVYHK